jgi:hypothetical protein
MVQNPWFRAIFSLGEARALEQLWSSYGTKPHQTATWILLPGTISVLIFDSKVISGRGMINIRVKMEL